AGHIQFGFGDINAHIGSRCIPPGLLSCNILRRDAQPCQLIRAHVAQATVRADGRRLLTHQAYKRSWQTLGGSGCQEPWVNKRSWSLHYFPDTRRGEGEVEAPSSTQVVSRDLSSFRHQIETKQNRKEKSPFHPTRSGNEKQGR